MNESITITATLPAFLPQFNSATRLLSSVRNGEADKAINMLHFSLTDMDKGKDPWARVGEAHITVTLTSRDEIVAAQVTALRAELDAERAEWMTKQQRILEQINKLQALEYSGDVA